MAASRPSTPLKNKTNVRAVGNRLNEATAEDFQELGAILDNHATILDSLTGGVSQNPSYGVFTSLSLLQATHPTAVEGGYAIIDAGVGTTAKIALWDDTDNIWVLQETTATTTTSKIVVGGTVTNVKVTDAEGAFYLIVSGTYEGPNVDKLESYSANSIVRAL